MKFLNVITAVAIGTVFLWIAAQADTPDTTREPNPMKVNQEQFARIEQANYAELVK